MFDAQYLLFAYCCGLPSHTCNYLEALTTDAYAHSVLQHHRLSTAHMFIPRPRIFEDPQSFLLQFWKPLILVNDFDDHELREPLSNADLIGASRATVLYPTFLFNIPVSLHIYSKNFFILGGAKRQSCDAAAVCLSGNGDARPALAALAAFSAPLPGNVANRLDGSITHALQNSAADQPRLILRHRPWHWGRAVSSYSSLWDLPFFSY